MCAPRDVINDDDVDLDDEAAQPAKDESSPQKTKKRSDLASGVSGAISGVLIGALLQPLDVLRTRLQGDSAFGIRRNALQAGKEIVKTQGVRGLWAGTGPSVLRMGMGVGLQMVLIERMSSALTKQLDGGASHLSAAHAMIASGFSRAVATALISPIAVIKTRMEYNGPNAIRYKNTFHALSQMTQTEGVGSLFRGLLPSILTNAPFSGMYYAIYKHLQKHLASEDRPVVLVNLSSSMTAAIAATIVTQPFDVIRTQIQLRKATAGTGSLPAMEMLSTLKSAIKQGPAALFIGTWPRVLKRSGQTALVWTLYEELVPRLTEAFIGLQAAAAAAAARQLSANSILK